MPTGLEVAEVFRRYGEAYRRTHAGHLGRVERRVMGAIVACRTAALGGHAEYCEECGLLRCAYDSCATGTAQSARASHAPSGLPSAKPNCCRYPISTSF